VIGRPVASPAEGIPRYPVLRSDPAYHPASSSARKQGRDSRRALWQSSPMVAACRQSVYMLESAGQLTRFTAHADVRAYQAGAIRHRLAYPRIGPADAVLCFNVSNAPLFYIEWNACPLWT
jgi:hypothetical protein